ncbi:MAG: DUF5667 domain-containing protein [Candidatus Shapirobacteria bacterium]
MISLSKEKSLKYFGRFFVLITSLAILFGSLVITGLDVVAKDKEIDDLRKVPIEYVKKMENGEEILKIYKVPESRIGPENKQYLIKKMRDKLWVDLSQNSKNKSEVCLLIADKKIFETVELIKNKKDEDLISKTLDEAFFHLKESKIMLAEENKKDIEIIKIDQKINEAV